MALDRAGLGGDPGPQPSRKGAGGGKAVSSHLFTQAVRSGALVLRAPERGTHPGVKSLGAILPGLCAAGYWDMSTELDLGLGWQTVHGMELNYLFRGGLDFTVDGKTFAMHSGQINVIRPWQTFQIGQQMVVPATRLGWVLLDVGVRRPNGRWKWPEWILLTSAERNRLAALLREGGQTVWKADAVIAEAFKRIAGVAGSEDEHFDRTGMALAINGLLLGMLRMLERHADATDDSPSLQTVEKFLDGLPGRAGEPWTVDSMAAACGMRRSRFTTLCEELKNQTPARHLIRCRIGAAARLLREQPKMSILDVALACGFASSQMFATAFRRVKGMAPREFRDGS